MQVPLVGLDEMARIVKAGAQSTIAFVDAADATSSGASGDSNAILRALMETGYTGRAPSANLPYLGHTRCPRPIFPLDSSVTFTPKAILFQRHTTRT